MSTQPNHQPQYPRPIYQQPPTPPHQAGTWPVRPQPPVVIYVPAREARPSLSNAQIVAIAVGMVLFLAAVGIGIMTILNVT